jgi:hypothetical protein
MSDSTTVFKKLLVDANNLLVDSVLDAVNLASLGRSSVDEMRSILSAIVGLSSDNDVIRKLAQLGVRLADDRHNMLDCEHEEREQKLLALKQAQS